MGKYADPTVSLIDKRFQVVNTNLNNMYTNVAANAQKISERRKAKSKVTADRISGSMSRYDKAIADDEQAARNFSMTRDLSNEKRMSLNQELQDVFIHGRDNITRFLALPENQDLSQNQIDEYINQQIMGAENFSISLQGLGTMTDEYTTALETARDSDGKEGGSIVVGSEYDEILTTMGMPQGDYNSSTDWGNLHVTKGKGDWDYNIFYDKEGGREGKVDRDEILNLQGISKNFKDGEFDSYFQTVPEEVISEQEGKSIATLINKTKKTEMFDDIIPYYDEEIGQVVKQSVPNQKNIETYFLEGEGKSTIDEIIESKGARALYQKFFGADAATSFNSGDENQMLQLKHAIIDEMDPYISSGSKNLKLNKTTSRTTFEKDPSFDVVKQFYDNDVKLIADFKTLQDANPKDDYSEVLDEQYAGRTMANNTIGGGYVIAGFRKIPDSIGEYEVAFATKGKKGVTKLVKTINFMDPLGTPDPNRLSEDQFRDMILSSNFRAQASQGHVKGLIELGDEYDPRKSKTTVSKQITSGLGTTTQAEQQIIDAKTGLPMPAVEEVEEEVIESSYVDHSADFKGASSYGAGDVTVTVTDDQRKELTKAAQEPRTKEGFIKANQIFEETAGRNFSGKLGSTAQDKAILNKYFYTDKEIGKINGIEQVYADKKPKYGFKKLFPEAKENTPQYDMLAMLNMNSSWNPKVIAAIASGKIKPDERRDYLFGKKDINEIKDIDLSSINAQDLLNQVTDLYKNTYAKSEDSTTMKNKEQLPEQYASYIERIKFLADRYGLDLPKDYNKFTK